MSAKCPSHREKKQLQTQIDNFSSSVQKSDHDWQQRLDALEAQNAQQLQELHLQIEQMKVDQVS